MPKDNIIITSGSTFDIKGKYGVSSLLEGSGKFHSFKEIKSFMKDLSFNERKSVGIKKLGLNRKGKVTYAVGGNRAVYVCSDINCKFLVKWRRKKNSKEPFYIVDQIPHSPLCSSTLKPSCRQLAHLSSINSTLGSTYNSTVQSSRLSMVQNEEIIITHSSSKSTVYKASQMARKALNSNNSVQKSTDTTHINEVHVEAV